MPKPAVPKFRKTNRRDYNTALKQRGSLGIWFGPGMARLAAANNRPCRPQRFSDSMIELCLMSTVRLVRIATPLTSDILERIGASYGIDAEVWCRLREVRLAVGRIQKKQLFNALREILDATRHRPSPRSDMAKAIAYGEATACAVQLP